MSSRKRMSLNKTWLPYHRKLYSRDLPVCKTKTKFHKYIPLQKEQIVPVYIQKQKTRMRTNTFFLIHIRESVLVLFGQKGLNILQKNIVRAVGSDTSVSASLRTHHPWVMPLPHIGCLSCTWVHITTLSIENPCYQTVGFYRFWEQLKYLHWIIFHYTRPSLSDL